MSTKKFRMKEKTSNGFDIIHPETDANIVKYSDTIGGVSVSNVSEAIVALKNNQSSGGGSTTHLYKHTLEVNSTTEFSDYYAHDIIIISTSNSTTNYTEVLNGAINLFQGVVAFPTEDYGGGEVYLYGLVSYSNGEILCRRFENYSGIVVYDKYSTNTMAITFSDVVTQIV